MNLKKKASKEDEEKKLNEEQAEQATPTMQDPMVDSDCEVDPVLQSQKT